MHKFRRFAAAGAIVLSTGIGAAAIAPTAQAGGLSLHRSCAAPKPGYAGCFALRVTAGGGGLGPNAAPAGYHPADLGSAYKLDRTKGVGQTVAIVDAFDDPKAESDLAVYRKQFGLPPCTTANGCFKKVNQMGGTIYPPPHPGWAEEISLDLDMVSAICPKCKILLVEATTNSFANLAAAVNRAALLGATEISNSYGGSEFSGETTTAGSYRHPGIPVTVSSGDGAYAAGPQVPAAFNTVVAVGGTRLVHASNARGWSETAWFTNTNEGAGSGCSAFVAKPAWQHDTGCARRTIADVAAVADPATGVTVYDSFGTDTGFEVFGGTSVSAPIIAAVFALAGNGTAINNASFEYSHTASLFDVTGGSTGTCGGSYLCTAKVGYDGPTGLGTPKGTGAF
jgi:subtilase family serine protease